ncbi:hypothetical protein B5X24_HaOG211483 [Helicoverpa armigera]|nr:hypothetical protein B5X24_HaOG211483 [Helicoverpa armigera]
MDGVRSALITSQSTSSNGAVMATKIEFTTVVRELDSNYVCVRVRICRRYVRTKCSGLVFVFAMFVFVRAYAPYLSSHDGAVGSG